MFIEFFHKLFWVISYIYHQVKKIIFFSILECIFCGSHLCLIRNFLCKIVLLKYYLKYKIYVVISAEVMIIKIHDCITPHWLMGFLLGMMRIAS